MDPPDRASAPPQILAEISLLATEEGGRQHPLGSPAPVAMYFDGRYWDSTGHLRDHRFIYPGQSAWIELTVSPWIEASERLYPGKPFLIREEGRIVAYGLVKQMLTDTEREATAEA